MSWEMTGRSRRYGFIEFQHSADMDTAYHEAHDMFLEGSKIIVDYECERFLPGWKPRRFGGGLGGYKESGQLRFGGRERPFKKPITLGSVRLGWKGGGRKGGGAWWHGRSDGERQRERSPQRQSYGRDSSTHLQRYSREHH